MTRVVHCKREPFDVYVGRPSQWGNPFREGVDGTRDEAIAKYEAWLLQQPELMAALPSLRGKVLACWCAPKSCHADVLVRLANADAGALTRRYLVNDCAECDRLSHLAGECDECPEHADAPTQPADIAVQITGPTFCATIWMRGACAPYLTIPRFAAVRNAVDCARQMRTATGVRECIAEAAVIARGLGFAAEVIEIGQHCRWPRDAAR